MSPNYRKGNHTGMYNYALIINCALFLFVLAHFSA